MEKWWGRELFWIYSWKGCFTVLEGRGKEFRQREEKEDQSVTSMNKYSFVAGNEEMAYLCCTYRFCFVVFRVSNSAWWYFMKCERVLRRYNAFVQANSLEFISSFRLPTTNSVSIYIHIMVRAGPVVVGWRLSFSFKGRQLTVDAWQPLASGELQ